MDLYGARESSTTDKSIAVLPQHVVHISQRSVRNVSNMFKAGTSNIRLAALKKLNKSFHKSHDKLN